MTLAEIVQSVLFLAAVCVIGAALVMPPTRRL